MDSSASPSEASDEGKIEKVEAVTPEAEIKAEAAAAPVAETPAEPVTAETPSEAPAESAAEPIKAESSEPKAEKTAAPIVLPPSGALIPFVAPTAEAAADAAGDDSPHRARFDRLLGYGAHAALIVALVGFAWALSGYVIRGFDTHGAKQPDAQVAALATEKADKAELQRSAQTMAAEIKTLRANVESLRLAAAKAPTQDEVRGLERTIDGLKTKLETAKAETGAALAQVAGKIDHMGEPTAKLREVAERLEKVERQTAAPITTASITPAPAATVTPARIPLPPVKVAAATTEAPEAKRPPAVSNWVVRDVYDGIALVEGPHGMLEVVQGEMIPGVGAVRSIEKRGAGWVVQTSRGTIEFARN